jgi:hypothetical protein
MGFRHRLKRSVTQSSAATMRFRRVREFGGGYFSVADVNIGLPLAAEAGTSSWMTARQGII